MQINSVYTTALCSEALTEATLPQACEDSGLLGISLEVKLPVIRKKSGGPCVCSRMFQNPLFEDYIPLLGTKR